MGEVISFEDYFKSSVKHRTIDYMMENNDIQTEEEAAYLLEFYSDLLEEELSEILGENTTLFPCPTGGYTKKPSIIKLN